MAQGSGKDEGERERDRETMSSASIVLGPILLIGVGATLDVDTVTSFSATSLLPHRPRSSPRPAS